MQVYTKRTRKTTRARPIPIQLTAMATIEQIRELLKEQATEFTKALKEQEERLMAKIEEKNAEDSASESQQSDQEEEEPHKKEDLESRKMKERLEMLEKSLAALKTHGDTVNIDSLSLFPKARLPSKFNMPVMDKFNGTTCPKTHLKMYVGALNPHGLSNELLAQLFQQSLTGAALNWFMSLDLTRIKTWEDICNAFIAQYNYNKEVDVTRRELETTKQYNNESFSSFLTT